MKKMFNENMSSMEAQKALFAYADAHRGEDMSDVKEEYRRIVNVIVRRESKENKGWMTSYKLV